ncbi:MAG: hypothetical protein WB992_25830 [Bryobacteraceae bacterium]
MNNSSASRPWKRFSAARFVWDAPSPCSDAIAVRRAAPLWAAARGAIQVSLGSQVWLAARFSLAAQVSVVSEVWVAARVSVGSQVLLVAQV